MTEEYRCAAGRRCRNPDIDKRGALIGEARGLCQNCTRAVVSACRGLDDDLRILGDAAEAGRVHGEVFVHSTPAPAIPLNTTVIALRSTLSDVCGAGVRLVAQKLNIEPVARQRHYGDTVHEDPVIAQAATVLGANVDLLLRAPVQSLVMWDRDGEHYRVREFDGIDVGLALLRVHRQIQSLGSPVKRQRLSMPCPLLDCGAMTLGIDEGDEHITCTSCGGIWKRTDYDRLALILIEDHKQMTKQLELAKWLIAERDWKLQEVRRIASLTQEQLDGIDGWAVVALLREVLATKVS